MAAAVVRGRKMEDGRRKGGGRSLYVSFDGHYFYAIIFMRLFYFRFYVVSLTRGPSKWGEGTNVVAPVRRGFFYFIFYILSVYCCLVGESTISLARGE